MSYTEKECIESLKKAREILGESPSIKQYNKLDLEPERASTIKRKFGSWNNAKEQASLEKLDKSSRNSPSYSEIPEDVDLSWKEWKNLTPHQRHYRRNKEKVKEWVSNQKEEYKTNFIEYKKTLECEECGENHPACLDFHHIEDKNENISTLVKRGHSMKKIREEIEKCEVLCANCHRKKHDTTYS